MPFPDFDPVLLEIGPFALRWYALAYVAGIVLAWLYAVRLIKTPALWRGEAPPATQQQVDDLILWLTLGIILGGRIGYVLFYRPDLFWTNPLEVLQIWNGGMSFHGGFLGVAVAVAVFARVNGIDLLRLGDLVAPCAPFGLFFGRVANFINGELWGRPTDAPWGVVFPAAPDSLPRHPSQLYEAALEGVVLFLILRWATHGAKFLPRRGMLTGLFLLFYGLFRIGVEFLREPDQHLPDVLRQYATLGMLLSIPMVLVGAWLVARARRRSEPAARADGAVPA
ncbi:MAG: prolipoprotein diacylglyceryl transferase [Proteobacteria bacterium]|nr:prolipoprotein diacylglyceryl transferase [Pseudomonadota bacterium]